MRYSTKRPARKHIVLPYRRVLMTLVSCALLLACGQLFAQTGGTGAITGTVADPNAAALPDARVKVADVATGDKRLLQFDAHGAFRASLLLPGITQSRSPSRVSSWPPSQM